jgi:hypothetical protein
MISIYVSKKRENSHLYNKQETKNKSSHHKNHKIILINSRLLSENLILILEEYIYILTKKN